jgi:hypothetical protein
MKALEMSYHTCLYACLVSAVALLLGACSIESDSGEVFVAGDAGHVENWANIEFLHTDVFHGSEVKDISTASGVTDAEISVDLCADCHGSDLDGGISGISCSSCHRGPDGMIQRPHHLAEWLAARGDRVHFHGGYASEFPTSCAGFCHGDTLTGGLGPSCFDCHQPGELDDILNNITEADKRP